MKSAAKLLNIRPDFKFAFVFIKLHAKESELLGDWSKMWMK